MSVRPFYIDSYIEGRETRLSGGPRRKDGEMRTVITQRSNGGIETAFSIECRTVIIDGIHKLVSSVYDHNGDLVVEHYTDY